MFYVRLEERQENLQGELLAFSLFFFFLLLLKKEEEVIGRTSTYDQEVLNLV